MNDKRNRNRSDFWLGILVAAVIAFAVGAVVQSNERYQVAVGYGPGGVGVFAIDTATGVTKAVYLSTDIQGKPQDYLGKPFKEIP